MDTATTDGFGECQQTCPVRLRSRWILAGCTQDTQQAGGHAVTTRGLPTKDQQLEEPSPTVRCSLPACRHPCGTPRCRICPTARSQPMFSARVLIAVARRKPSLQGTRFSPPLRRPAAPKMLTGLPDLSSKRKERTLLTAVPNPNHPQPELCQLPGSWMCPSLPQPCAGPDPRRSDRVPNTSQVRWICRVGDLPYPCCYDTGSPADVIAISPATSWKGLASPEQVGVLSHNFPASRPTMVDETPTHPCHSPLGTRTLLPFPSPPSRVAPASLAFRGVSHLALQLPHGFHLCI